MLEQENRGPEFKDIKGYVAKELKNISQSIYDIKPIVLFDSSRREVIIKTFDPSLKGKKVYTIPLPSEKDKFQQSWIDVFMGCFNYMKERAKREGIIIIEGENSITINNHIYRFNSYEEYITTLQKELENQIEKKKQVGTPVVNKQSIKIFTAEENKANNEHANSINNMVAKRQLAELIKSKKVEEPTPPIQKEEEIVKEKIVVPIEKEEKKQKLTATLPSGKYSITKDTIKEEVPTEETNFNMNDNQPLSYEDLNTWKNKIEESNKETKIEIEKPKIKEEEPTISTKENVSKKDRKTTNYKELKKLQSRFCGAVTDDEALTLSDCSLLRDKPIVLLTNSLSKNSEIIFYDNIELINENINVPIGAFITGKGTSSDKILKEITKINNLCKKDITSGVICYEPNERAIKNADGRELIDIVGAIKQLTEMLAQEYGYTLMICLDIESAKLVGSTNIGFNCPVLIRVSSKNLEDITDENDVIIMHPEIDYDQLSLTDRTANYIQAAINKNLENQRTSSK